MLLLTLFFAIDLKEWASTTVGLLDNELTREGTIHRTRELTTTASSYIQDKMAICFSKSRKDRCMQDIKSHIEFALLVKSIDIPEVNIEELQCELNKVNNKKFRQRMQLVIKHASTGLEKRGLCIGCTCFAVGLGLSVSGVATPVGLVLLVVGLLFSIAMLSVN